MILTLFPIFMVVLLLIAAVSFCQFRHERLRRKLDMAREKPARN